MLGISLDYAFCLHSKERVPYHVVIKVALDDKPAHESPYGRSLDEDDSSSSSSENLVATPLI